MWRTVYIDYINFDAVVDVLGGNIKEYQKYLNTIADLIQNGLKSPDITVKAKYGWMARHYMQTKRSIEETPLDSRFRSENPDYIEKN